MAIKKFPGFIDVHVHLRDPGATHKEDFQTGSRAAVKGGFTFVIDMPNNPTPTISPEALQEKIRLAEQKSIVDIGFHYGTDGQNTETFKTVIDNEKVFGLKIYCNYTTGTLLVEDQLLWNNIFREWESKKPILVHAEKEKLPYMIALSKKYNRHLHVCHISLTEEVSMVRRAKEIGIYISAGVTPHHLFLTEKDVNRLGSLAMMKPPLGTQADQEALWKGLRDGTIDLIETDHAPHTKEEKEKTPAPFGVPGLETAVGLMFKAVHEGKISEREVIKFFHDNPARIFNVPTHENTFIMLDPDQSYIMGEDGYETKCHWSPFDGWKLYGQIQMVVIKGKTILEKRKLI
ncbi:dihydroorotase family protein [Candidatus Azambacteria bacterium]|nr:dihydroorotase family protein [Candidatus Azambacteria bacterium]